jgi:hypothetical protein
MTQKYEWDFPATMRPRRKRPRIEIIEPDDPPRRLRVDVEVHHHHRPRLNPQTAVVIVAAAFAVIMIVRFPLGFLLLPILLGRKIVLTGLFVVVVLAVIAMINRWRGKPF